MPVDAKEGAAAASDDAVVNVVFPEESWEESSWEKSSSSSSSSSSKRTTTTKRKTTTRTKILLLVLSLCCCCCCLLLLSADVRFLFTSSFQKGGSHFKRRRSFSLPPPRSALKEEEVPRSSALKKEEGDVHHHNHQRPPRVPCENVSLDSNARIQSKEEGDVHHHNHQRRPPRVVPYDVSFDSKAIVVTACVGRHERLKKLSESNKETYARAHDFDFVSGSAEQYPAMTFVQPFAWFKVALLLDVMKIVRAARTKHEWVLWVDCDALISNLDENLVRLANRLIEEERGKRQNEIDVIVAFDEGETERINSGVMFVRNSQWSLDFFSTVLRKAEQERLRQHRHWEQAAINELILNKNEAWSGHFLKVKRNQINSFQPQKDLSRRHPDNRFRKGETFVVHRVNCHNVTLCDEVYKSWFCHVHSEDTRFQRKCQNSKSISFFDTAQK